MGLFAKIIYSTPFGRYYKEYNHKKWERTHAKMEEELFPQRVIFYKQFIDNGDLVFDIGANIGNRTEVFLSCGARVVAIEPQPSCVQELKRKFGEKIIIEAIGLSETPGELQMHVASDTTVSTFDGQFIEETKKKFKYTQWNETVNVPVNTLDYLIEKYGTPKFCKIDVEGYEIHVLKGLHSIVPCISFEYIVPERKQSALKCIAQLIKIAPQGRFNYSIGESMKWALPEFMNYESFEKHLNSPEFLNTTFGDIYFKVNENK